MAFSWRTLLLGVTTWMSLSAQEPLMLPDGDGKKLVQRICVGCHSLETAIDATRTESGWRGVVDAMAGRGAKGTDSEFNTVVKYLARNFGRSGPAATKSAVAVEAAPGKSS